MTCPPTILLASSSSARAGMLHNAGVKFTVKPPLVDETILKERLRNDPCETVAATIAERKSLSLAPEYPDALIIGSDQTLILGHKLFNKASDLSTLRDTLRTLRGQEHTLRSAVCVTRNASVLWSHQNVAYLRMRNFSDQFLEAYLQLEGDTLLNAVGAYRVEGPGIQLFDSIVGDHYTILGMPLLPLITFLRSYGAIAK
jgi:septum formation protein